MFPRGAPCFQKTKLSLFSYIPIWLFVLFSEQLFSLEKCLLIQKNLNFSKFPFQAIGFKYSNLFTMQDGVRRSWTGGNSLMGPDTGPFYIFLLCTVLFPISAWTLYFGTVLHDSQAPDLFRVLQVAQFNIIIINIHASWYGFRLCVAEGQVFAILYFSHEKLIIRPNQRWVLGRPGLIILLGLTGWNDLCLSDGLVWAHVQFTLSEFFVNPFISSYMQYLHVCVYKCVVTYSIS